MPDFQPGAMQAQTNAVFGNYYDTLKEPRTPELVYPFANQRFTDLADLMMDRKAVEGLFYITYERDRWMPKIIATNAGAGGAGGEVTFTVTSADEITLDYGLPDPPYNSDDSSDQKKFPVRVRDIIQLRPGTGTAASGNMIQCRVTEVTPASSEFKARPVKETESIPAINTAQEIIILYNQSGDAQGVASPMSLTWSKYQNEMNHGSHSTNITNHAEMSRMWFTDASGQNKYWTPKVTAEHLDIALNQRELACLLGEKVNNTDITEPSAATDNPLASGNGLIPEMLSRSNIFEYSAVTGPTFNWFRNISMVLKKQKGADYNMFMMGQKLRSDINKMGLDELQGGVINIGNFRGDEEKFISLSFKRIEVDGVYYDLKTMPSFIDLQTLGAADYPYPREGMIIPERLALDKDSGSMVTPIRSRFATDIDGRDCSMKTELFDGTRHSDSGAQYKQLRFYYSMGIELLAGNQSGYAKVSQG